MPSINFKGAQNFTISGGNFGDIAGGVVSYNFGNGFEFTRTNAFTEYVDAVGTNTEHRFPSRRRHMLAQRRSTGSPPPRDRIKPAPHRSDSAPASQALIRLGSPLHSEGTPRAPTPPPTPFDQSFPSSPTVSTISSLTRYSTPLMSPRPDDVDVELTPLTESLGLNSRLTPNPQTFTLSSANGILEDVQGQANARPPVSRDTRGLNVQSQVESSHVLNALHIGEITNPPPPMPPRSESHTNTSDSFVSSIANRDIHSRLGPPPPHPPRPMMPSAVSRSTGVLNMAQHRMQNYIEALPRTSSPEPMQLERRDPSPCLQMEDTSARDSTGGRPSFDPSLSVQQSAQSRNNVSSLTQQDILTVSQDGFGPLAGTPTLSTVSELSVAEKMPEDQPHWTADSIGDWAGHIKGGDDLDRMQERRGDFRPAAAFAARRSSCQTDNRNCPSLHGTSFQHSSQYIDHANRNTGCCGASQHQASLHQPYFPPYSFSSFPFNTYASQRHPYHGGIVFVAPWAGVWQ